MKLLAPEELPDYLDGIQTLVAEKEETILGYAKPSRGPMGPPETPRSQQLEATLERLVGSFPEGRQVEGIRAGLAKYRALLEELRASQLPDDELPEE